MRQPDSLSTKTAPLLQLFNKNKASTVSFQDDTLTILAKSGRVAHSLTVSEIGEVQLQKLPLLTRLTVSTQARTGYHRQRAPARHLRDRP